MKRLILHPVADRGRKLNRLYRRLVHKKARQAVHSLTAAANDQRVGLAGNHGGGFGQASRLSDAELTERMVSSERNGPQVRELLAGGRAGYLSRSEGDLSLVNHLLYWTDGDVARVDSLFRQSGRMRPKWDSPRGKSTWGAWTIAKAEQNRIAPARGRLVVSQPMALKPALPALQLMGSAVFAQADYVIRYLVHWLMVAGQPMIVGGARKALKTSILIDLVISLGAARPFLGFSKFAVSEQVRVGFFSGESGPHTIQDTARNVCSAKGLRLNQLEGWVWWCFALPQLSQAEQLQALADQIRLHRLQVVVIDPLYLCLLAGNKDVEASNLFDMGPLLRHVAEVCLQAGATPVFCHHATKRLANQYEPLELEDLAFAGIQEFARQWILLGRRERFQAGTGLHKLWLNVGGSVGFSSEWALDINEGVPDEDFHGKQWLPCVFDPDQAVANAARDRQSQRNVADDAKVLAGLDHADPDGAGLSMTKLREQAGLQTSKVRASVNRLIDRLILERLPVQVVMGNGARRNVSGIRRRIGYGLGTSGTTGNPDVHPECPG